jgi:integration host factor subunit beta
MTKSRLIRQLSEQRNIPNADALTVVETVFESIAGALERGDKAELRGFGTFGLKERRAREGRNPKTGESVKVEAKRVMFFKAGKEMRERVDG